MFLNPKVTGSDVSVVWCQQMESRGQWVEWVRQGGGYGGGDGGGDGKTIGDLMLF